MGKQSWCSIILIREKYSSLDNGIVARSNSLVVVAYFYYNGGQQIKQLDENELVNGLEAYPVLIPRLLPDFINRE